MVDPRLRASNEHIPIVRVPRAGGRPGCPFSSLCFRRRPVQFGVSPAVEAGEVVTGLAPGIRHGGKSDGGVVDRAREIEDVPGVFL